MEGKKRERDIHGFFGVVNVDWPCGVGGDEKGERRSGLGSLGKSLAMLAFIYRGLKVFEVRAISRGAKSRFRGQRFLSDGFADRFPLLEECV